MKFEKIVLELEKYESLDIIATSQEEPSTGAPEVVTKHDPYGDDKW